MVVKLLRQAFAEGRIFTVDALFLMEYEPLRNYPPFRELMRAKG